MADADVDHANVDRDDLVHASSTELDQASNKRERSESPLFEPQTAYESEREAKRPKLESNTPASTNDLDGQPDNVTPTSIRDPSMQSNLSTTSTSLSVSAGESVTQPNAGVLERPGKKVLQHEQLPTNSTSVTETSVRAVSSPREAVAQHQAMTSPADGPRFAAYNPLFQQAENATSLVCSEFIAALEEAKKTPFRNDDIEHISRQLAGFRDIKKHYPKTKPVALIGPMGAGKSRTINSILDQPGIALDSDSSDRGTNVVHEYHGPEFQQTEKYRINVVYYSTEQLKAHILTLVSSIYDYLAMDEDDDLDQDECTDLEEKYNDALEYFGITLCGRQDFQTKDDADEFFEKHHTSGTKKQELATILEDYLNEFKSSRGVIDNVESHIAHDETDLSQVFARVSKPSDVGGSKHAHPWPLIRKMEVRVRDSELLRRGAVIADTPGIADSDKLVVNRTSLYLENEVGIILLLSPILRTQRLNDLNNILRTCWSLKKADSTYLVMTKIDQKDFPVKAHEKEAMKPRFRQAIDAADARKKELEDEQVVLRSKRQEVMGRLTNSEAFTEFGQIQAQQDRIPCLIEEQEAIAFRASIESRNADTRGLLGGRFREISRTSTAKDLKMIFVSNEEYQNITASRPARLDLETTGIPSLRRLIHGVPAASKFGILQNICLEQLVPLLRGVRPSLTQTKLERKAEVEKELVCVLGDSKNVVDSLTRSVQRFFEDMIGAQFARCEQAWRGKGERLVAEWNGYHASKFWAFCRRGGVWKLCKGGDEISWDELIQEIFADDVALAFDNEFWPAFGEAKSAAESQIRDHFKAVEKALKACPGFQGKGDDFYKTLRHIRDQTVESMGRHIESLRQQIMSIYNDMVLAPEGMTTYVDVAMRATYLEGAQIKAAQAMTGKGKKNKVSRGKGAHSERADTVRRRLNGTGRAAEFKKETEDEDENEALDENDRQLSVFQSVFRQAEVEFKGVLSRFTVAAETKIEAKCDEIMADFNRRFSVEEESSSLDPEAVQLLIDTADRGLEQLLGPVKQQLEECKRWERDGDIITT